MILLIIGMVLYVLALTLAWFEISGIDLAVGIIATVLFTIGWGQLHQKPTAMDVYQGKTTLEITYKDGVAIDSVVVFKDKK